MLRCVEEDLELSLANIEVFHCESVGNVPADGSEFTSVLNDSVEEAEPEEKLLVRLGLGASSERIVIERFVGTKYVLL